MLSREQVQTIRKDFPYLQKDNNFVYLDNAATVQKPSCIIEVLEEYYRFENGNPHRGAHYFAMKSTEVYESARVAVRKFIGAKSSDEIVFLRNTTEAINLVAYSWAMENLHEGDEIVLSIMEHHSNCVPWQYVAKKTGAKLVYLYLDEEKQISETTWNDKLSKNTKLFAFTMASNVVATIPNAKQMIAAAKKNNPTIKILLDAAQYAPHAKLDVSDLDCDFLVFSGHKMFSAMGIGVLYGKKELFNSMQPFLYGGDMIEYVYEDRATFLNAPQRFEAGTVNVGGAKTLMRAISYLEEIGMEDIVQYETSLMDYAYQKMTELPYIEVYSTQLSNRGPVLSFQFKEVHPHDVASILDGYKIAVRSGHHCAQPLHRYLNIHSSCRASFSFYNTHEEIDYFVKHLEEVRKVMGIEY